MQKTHAGSIKGMSIACIAVSAVLLGLYLVGALAIASVGALGTSYLDSQNTPSMGRGGIFDYDDYYDDIYGDYDDYYDFYYDSSKILDDDDVVEALFGVLGGVFAFCAALSAVSLVAGIIALSAWNKPQKYGRVFGWSIAGAVVGFLTSGPVLTVLFVLIAVFASIDKKRYAAGAYPGAYPSGQGFTPGQASVPGPGYGQGYAPGAQAPGAPVQGAPVQGAPVQGAPVQVTPVQGAQAQATQAQAQAQAPSQEAPAQVLPSATSAGEAAASVDEAPAGTGEAAGVTLAASAPQAAEPGPADDTAQAAKPGTDDASSDE